MLAIMSIVTFNVLCKRTALHPSNPNCDETTVYMQNIPTIETDRLRLRAVVATDRDDIFDIFSDDEVIRYYDVEAFTSTEQAAGVIDGFAQWFQRQEAVRWGVTLIDSGKLIGTCCFDGIHTPFRRANLGYNLGSAYWRQGYALEACQAIVDFAFSKGLFGPIHRVQAITVPENSASEFLLDKLGFQHEAVLQHYGFWKGLPRDMNMFALLKENYNGNASGKS